MERRGMASSKPGSDPIHDQVDSINRLYSFQLLAESTCTCTLHSYMINLTFFDHCASSKMSRRKCIYTVHVRTCMLHTIHKNLS